MPTARLLRFWITNTSDVGRIRNGETMFLDREVVCLRRVFVLSSDALQKAYRLPNPSDMRLVSRRPKDELVSLSFPPRSRSAVR